MGAATNIPISATTTDYISAIEAARRVTSQFDRNIAHLVTSFGSASSASTRFSSANRQAMNDARQAAQQLNSIKNAVAGAFAVDKVLEFANAITGTSGKFEKFGSILTNALQSGSGAKDNLRALTDFAANTPNQLDEMTGSFIKFVNRGLIPTQTQLTSFGDLAASQGKSFDQLTEAILDAQTGEFERLKEFGVRASKSGDQVSLSFKGVTQTVKANSGAITEAIEKFGQLTGVAGSMSAVAQTQEGMVSNLSDTYDRLMVALGEGGVSGSYKAVLGSASAFLTVLTDLIAASPVEDLRNQQSEINGLVGAIALANDNEAVRLELIQKLGREYPEFLGNLNAEYVTSDLLAKRLADVNKQYEQKIRIALGQEKIKKTTEEFTKSIDEQAKALEFLAKASGKPITELEKLNSAQRLAMAKDLARSAPRQITTLGTVAPTQMDYVVNVLERGGTKQKQLQEELNKLTSENATRQAELTKTTVEGYQSQIKQIQQKVKLHQIDAKVGAEEIKRLNEQVRIAQGIAKVDTTPTGTGTKKKKAVQGKTASLQETGDLAILKRYAADLETQIQNLGGKASDELVTKLNNARGAIESIQALTSKSQTVSITGIKEIINSDAILEFNAALTAAQKTAEFLPAMFAKTGLNDFLSDIEKARPSLDAIRAKIEEIKATIAGLKLNNKVIPPDLIQKLKDLKQLMASSTEAANNADASTEPGGDGADNERWLAKARNRIAAMKAAGKEVKVTEKELADQMKGAATGFAQASFAALRSIGAALGSGGDPLKAALKSLTDSLGNYLIQQGEALAMAALFSQAAALAAGPFAPLLSVPVPFQLAAAGVMIAGGAALQSFGGSFEKGGLIKGRKLIEVGESAKALGGGGEWVSPVDKGADLISARIGKNMASLFSNQNQGNDLIAQLNRSPFGNIATRMQDYGTRIQSNGSIPSVITVKVDSRTRGKDIHHSGQTYLRTRGDFV